MVATQIQSIEQSQRRDGCLLLWLEGNVLFSLNESALVIWAEMERNPKGTSREQLVEYLDKYYIGCDVSKIRLRLDVTELIDHLSKRGFLTQVNVNGGPPRYKIKEDVFRTAARVLEDAGQGFDSAMAYRPSKAPAVGRVQAITDSCLAFTAFLAYEVFLRLRGFGRLCVLVERWPLAKRRRWTATRVRQICAGIDRARLWYPKKIQCLQHSAVVTCLLRLQGVPAQMVFAAARKPFYAHAWCEVEGTVVNDEQSVRERYSTFTRCTGKQRAKMHNQVVES
jgi:Transglutaminase-like superfamily/Coenzyme PQQ synthesis protein D (PqqD)